jgi:Tfp pilus assembly protein PilE
MKNEKGISLIEVCVVILIIVLLVMIFSPAKSKVKVVSKQIVCRTHLMGLGLSFSIYADDYNGYGPQLPGNGPWSKKLGFAYNLTSPDFEGKQANTTRTITASWFLLVKQAELSLGVFVCPESTQTNFEDIVPDDYDIYNNLWDFGSNPYNHVSYSMHNPYGKYPANMSKPSGFAIAADNNPWFKDGSLIEPSKNSNMPPQIISYQNDKTYKLGNSMNHTKYKESFLFWKYTKHSTLGIGQNVLYIDGSVVFKETPNCGIKNDNIFTFWSNEENPTEQDIQGGSNAKERNPENDAKSEEDSFLVF